MLEDHFFGAEQGLKGPIESHSEQCSRSEDGFKPDAASGDQGALGPSSRKSRKALMAVAVLFPLFLFSVPVLSQTSQDTIQGVNTNPMSAVIPGFKEGLKLMPVGSIY
jgi:hypothetical protein